MTKLAILLGVLLVVARLALGCGGNSSAGGPSGTDAGDSSAPHDAGVEGASRDAAAPSDAEAGVPPPPTLAFHCAATSALIDPNPCPPPSGKDGEADFCYRAQWANVTTVDVYGGFGQATDWTMPFLMLANDGSGTFTGKASIANGSYPYVFRTTGSADNLVSDGHYFLDQENTQFEEAPDAAPDRRSVSVITVPQGSQPLVHIKGTVLYQGQPQSCYSIDLEAGERVDGGKVESEHDTANFTESAADGTFDFPVAANAPYMVTIRFPFELAGTDAGYPDPSTTPSVGIARSTMNVGDADLALTPTEISYPLSGYAAMAPTGGTATLPVTFSFTVVPGSTGASVWVIGTDIAGNDPAYSSVSSTSTSLTWDGGFNGMGGVKLGTTYYWGAWQERTPNVDGGVTWGEQSFLFPIVFH